jgi:phytoene dehydrogenase-like protein
VEKDGAARAAPTGAPWIDTNTGFLRFARALTHKPFWIANTPPPKSVFPVERYLQAIADAAASGAQWVISLDEDFARRLQAGDGAALRDWRRIAELAKHFDSHPEWRSFAAAGQFAVVLDATAGALVSGGVLDMVATRHTPVRPVPLARLTGDRLEGAKVVVNIDPEILTDEKKQVLRRFAASGGTLLNAPPGWKFSTPPGSLTLSKEDLEKLDSIWREVNSVTGRRNFGARLFNVSSMLSNLLAPSGGKQLVLHLVNYSNYPVEDITVHVQGKYSKATLYAPGAPPAALAVYPVEEGAGLEISRLGVTGTVVIEP